MHCKEGVESLRVVGASVWGAWEGGVGVGEVFGGVVLVELGDVHFRVKGRRGDGGLCEADGDGGADGYGGVAEDSGDVCEGVVSGVSVFAASGYDGCVVCGEFGGDLGVSGLCLRAGLRFGFGVRRIRLRRRGLLVGRRTGPFRGGRVGL